MSGRHAELTDPHSNLPELPSVHDTTLGFAALDYHNSELYAGRQNQLADVRTQLKELSPKQKQLADIYLEQYFPEQVANESHTNLTDWLSDENSVNDDILLDFLQRHTEEVAFQQHSEETQLMVKHLKTEYINRVTAAHADGWLADTMVQRLGQVEDAGIIIGDAWDTIINGSLAYHTPGKHRRFIVVGQAFDVAHPHDDLKKKLILTAWHELIHLETGYVHARWFTEAGDEHVNQSLKFGQWNVIDPRLRRNDHGGYPDERQLLAAVTHLGKRPIDPMLVTQAFSSGGRDSKEWQDFSEAVDRSWGVNNVLNLVKQKIAIYEFHIRRQDKLRVDAERAVGHAAFPKDENTVQREAVQHMIAEVERSRRDKEPTKKPQQVGAAAVGHIRVNVVATSFWS